MPSRKGKLLSMLSSLALISLGLNGCGNSGVAHDYCYIYDPIQASDSDTKETLDAVDKENGKWLCICQDDCPRKSADQPFSEPVPPQ